MKKFAVVFVMALFFASVAYAEVTTTTSSVTSTQAPVLKKYFCPMDGFQSDMPGKCEKCGMQLIERATVTKTVTTKVKE